MYIWRTEISKRRNYKRSSNQSRYVLPQLPGWGHHGPVDIQTRAEGKSWQGPDAPYDAFAAG